MLLVGRPQSFLEPNLQPGKPPVLTCLPVLILVLSSGFSMPSRAKKNTSQDSSFPDCTCPLDTAKHFASYLRSRLSQATPRFPRRAERQFMNELRKASCEDASSLHNSFCSPFLIELSTAISNFSSSTASGPDQIAYPLLKPEPAQLLLLLFLTGPGTLTPSPLVGNLPLSSPFINVENPFPLHPFFAPFPSPPASPSFLSA